MSTQIENKKDVTCVYCGNNPTSHVGAWFDSTLGLFLGPLFNRTFTIPGGKPLLVMAEYIVDSLWDLSVVTGMVKYSNDHTVIPTDRGKVVYDEALRRGWKMETAIIFGRPVDVYRIIFPNEKKLNFSGLPRLDSEIDATANWIDDKALLKQRLLASGVHASRGGSFHSSAAAEAYFKKQSGPVIVKPRLGSRGRHTTTYITTLDDFKVAFKRAKQLGHFVIVEEHLTGSVYRATMVDGKLAGVLAGDPPRIVGDGVHTIRELIAIKNETRHERVGEVRITDTLEIFLARRKLTLDTVLEEGKTIDLSEKIGLSYGGNAREVTPQVHPKLHAELERAAQVVHDPIIGFDFITPDVSVDPDTVHWGIIECNALPFINLHHDPLEGEPVNVAGIFLDYIERNLPYKIS